ncbi:MAG: CehA/McbA family metallohydrolase [Defluviitaleaceae bacterium]|nr:CehA/McbA family metallohydrolase [Defluviitaleaceae bacterium]
MKFHFKKEQEKQYIKIPFDVPQGIESIDIVYLYDRQSGAVIDLALLGPGDKLLGASGSTREHIWVSALGSCTGYETLDPPPGEWNILAGLYKLPPDGAEAEYGIKLNPKSRRLFKGDPHIHTTASDGKADFSSIISLAWEQRLDFIFLTDHNNTAQNKLAGPFENLTVIPGVEWTHYNGHALFLGAENPLEDNYGITDFEEGKKLIKKAKNAGAFTAIAHPLCHYLSWQWGLDEGTLSLFDGFEVWNGIMHERNERAIAFWHKLLCEGKKIPATCGSDYHGPGLFGSVGMPCLNVYALSRSPSDIMAAIRKGNSFISYTPDGPEVDIICEGNGAIGETVVPGAALTFYFANLSHGDEITLITDAESEKISVNINGRLILERVYRDSKFVRTEVYRSYAPGLPPMKAMLSNPVYFSP